MTNEKSHHRKFEELCAGYVLHALDNEERKEFEQMLAEASEKERTLYQNMQSAANQLAFTIERDKPKETLKKELMAQIRSEENNKQVKNDIQTIKDTQENTEDNNGFNWSAFGIATSFALSFITLSLMFYAFNLRSEINENKSVIANQETQITELEDELQQKEEMLAILESRNIDMVHMSGMEVNPNGYGKIIWDAEKQQALLQVSNLPIVPQDKDYQLWIIKDNKPVSAGVFTVNNEDNKFFKIKEMTDVNALSNNSFAVTMEPKGGMPQPTGDMYLMGNMEK
jgi:anti-sigma-K factor RskA